MTQEAHPVLRDHLEKWDGERGGGIQEGGNICTLQADSQHCTTQFKEIILQLKKILDSIYLYQILILYTPNIFSFICQFCFKQYSAC